MYVNIENVINKGDKVERLFFEWLSNNNIGWYQKGSNLNNIWVFDENQCLEILKQWDEVVLHKS